MTSSWRSLLAVGITGVFVFGILVWRNATTKAPIKRLTETQENATRVYEGSWYFPRGGPYILAFDAETPAKLFIDGHLVLTGRGRQSRRLVYEAGSVAVRVETTGTLQLLWHPPGRRGPLEYVPASSLAPKGPSPVFYRPGTSVSDGVYALAIVLALIACCLYLSRKELKCIDRKTALWVLGVILFALVVRVIGLNDQGQTWDEDVNWSAGRNYIANLLSLDFSQSAWTFNLEHPPIMKYLAGIGAQFEDGYGVSRFVSALLVSLACGLLVAIGARLFTLRVGILAGLLASLSPHIIAHSKVVGHEAPSMFFWCLGIYLSLRAHDAADGRFFLHKRFAVIGVVLGLAVSSRFINGLLAPVVGGTLLVCAPPNERKRTLLLGVSVLTLSALVTCIAVWPRLWVDAVQHLQESWGTLKNPHSLEPFWGQMTNRPPRWYFFAYIWATAPLGLLCLSVAGALRVLWRRDRTTCVLLLWFFAPLVVMFSPVRQDGVRYVMPTLLALALLAAVGVEFLAQYAANLGSILQPFWLLSVVLCGYLSWVCYRIHPYYLDYYGEQVGGPEAVAAQKKYEIAWWGEGLNEALSYLNEHAKEGAKIYKHCVAPSHLAWLRGDLWHSVVNDPHGAEWLLVYQPTVGTCRVPEDAERVFAVTAQGASLAEVYRRVP